MNNINAKIEKKVYCKTMIIISLRKYLKQIHIYKKDLMRVCSASMSPKKSF